MEYLTAPQPTEEKIPKKRVGRPVATDTPAALKRKLDGERRRAKRQRMTSEEECVYDASKCACGEHHQVWSASIISKLRLVVGSLSTVKQRMFLEPGSRCDLNTKAIDKHLQAVENGDFTTLSNTKLHLNFRLERPEVLLDKLDRWISCDPRKVGRDCWSPR